MAAYWTIEKEKDVEDVKTIKPFQEAKVGGNMAQYPPEDEEEPTPDPSIKGSETEKSLPSGGDLEEA